MLQLCGRQKNKMPMNYGKCNLYFTIFLKLLFSGSAELFFFFFFFGELISRIFYWAYHNSEDCLSNSLALLPYLLAMSTCQRQ